MNTKSISWLLGLLPVMAVLAFALLGRNTRQTATSGRTMPASAETQRSLPDAGELRDAKISELKEQIDQGMAEEARLRTRAVQEALVAAHMEQIQERCSPLFKAWNLDAGTVRETMRLIQERETNLKKIRAEKLRGGMAQAGEARTDRMVEKSLIENQMISLLGQKRYNELAAIESELEKENIRKGMNLARD